MKKTLLLCALILGSAVPAAAQFDLVTGQVTDPNGVPYSGATVRAQLTINGVNVTGQPTVTIASQAQCISAGLGNAPCQMPFPGTQSFTLDSNGNFPGGGINLEHNPSVTPAGTQWTFSITISPGVPAPLGTGPQSFSLAVTINSNPFPIGLTLTAAAPSLALTSVATSGNPFIGALVQSGLIGEYRILPSETPAALIDYSLNRANGNNAIGTVGTAPTIQATSGGLLCNGAGAVILPPALNSAKTIQVYINFGAIASGTFNSPVFGNGAGGASGGTGLVFAISSPTPGFGFNRVEAVSANVARTVQKSAFAGTGVVSLVMDTADRIYIVNKEEQVYVVGPGVSAGLQTTGGYQLCGSATGASSFTPNYMTGFVYYAIFYNRVLSPTEITQNTQALNQIMAARGVPPILAGTPGPNAPTFFGGSQPQNALGNQAVFDGDSITAGQGLTNPWPSAVVLNSANGAWNLVNQGLTGEAIGAGQSPATCAGNASMLCNGDYAVDMDFRPAAQRNVVTVWGGTNDMFNSSATAPDTWAAALAYCRQRKLLPWKTLYASMISRVNATGDSEKNALNALDRANWSQCFDGFVDVASDPNLGADGAFSNATYFQGDATHPTQNSAYNIIAPMMNRAINRLYGAHDFSSGSVYASAAAAATATTAGSESTNTVTLTFASNPFPLGAYVVCTGITPAGYNSPAGLGWYVLSSSATQITFFNPTTGLGAITVQGSCSQPQQLDGDQYYTVNFGAGNTTLETCRGSTGQNIYIRNINAAGSTLVPFGSETITGPGTTALAANTTAILLSQLVSASASGCNWVRIQ